MKILVISQYYYPENFQVNEVCEQMVKDGHEVTVLTGLPNYPTGKVPKEYKHGKRRCEKINGVQVLRCWEIGRKPGIIGMGLNYLSYAISSSLKVIRQKKYDVSFVFEVSPVTMILPGIILKKIHNIPCVVYCCDLWPESIKLLISNEEGMIYKVVNKVSKYLYKNASKVLVQSKSFIEYLIKQHGLNREKLSYLPQFASSEYLDMNLKKEKGNTVDFMFMGNIGIAQDIGNILDAVYLIRDVKNFKVHFVGDGSYLEKAKGIVNKCNLEDKVIFYGRKDFDELPGFYKKADVCIATLIGNSIVSSTIPSKVQGYMAAGKPILAALTGSAKNIINCEARCGICVSPSNPKELAQAMLAFINMKEKEITTLGLNSSIYFKKNFTKGRYMSSLYKEMDDLLWNKEQ